MYLASSSRKFEDNNLKIQISLCPSKSNFTLPCTEFRVSEPLAIARLEYVHHWAGGGTQLENFVFLEVLQPRLALVDIQAVAGH